ncbi:MAG: hypothetical protein M3273_08625, partial [Actinomycetota bacterium]|nr:hypothetical protein [Actinomycetota bacterium]
AAVAVFFSAAACGGGNDRAATPTPCPARSSVPVPASLPRVLDQTSHGQVVEVGRRRGFTAVRLISPETVVELYPQLARGLIEGGHRILSGDNEGFEAEIFFDLRDGRTGRYVLREGPCPKEVTLHILYEEKR